MTEREKFLEWLKKNKTKNFKIFRGSDPNVTAEQIYGELNKMIEEMESGKAEIIVFSDSHFKEGENG